VSPLPPVFAVILAAGRSTRFHGDKLLATIEGRPILGHVVEAVRECENLGLIRAMYVVVADERGPVARLAREGDAIVVKAPWAAEGLAQSLRAGLARVEGSAPSGSAGMLVLLGDQPGVRPAVIESLVRRWRATGAAVVRPRYAEDPDAPGHPVLIDRKLWPRVAELEGDSGWGASEAQADVIMVDVAGGNPDIDTKSDLMTWGRKGIS
jgi:molybdenum cofactor cytidylyltransferase